MSAMEWKGAASLRIEAFLKTPLLAGASWYGGAADKGTSRWTDGTAYIPGSALRGAFREALERLCGSGDATVFRLFGKAGSVDDGGCLLFEDLVPDKRHGAMARLRTVRNRVALSRLSRSAVANRYFQEELCPALPGMPFCGSIVSLRPLSEEELSLLKAASRLVATTGLGGGKASGLGMMELRLVPEEAAERESEPVRMSPGRYLLSLRFFRKFRCSPEKSSAYLYDTFAHVPARTIRGALLGASAREEFCSPEMLRVSPLRQACSRQELPLPVPNTAVIPKIGGEAVWDSLFWHLAAAFADRRREGFVLAPDEKGGLPLKPASGILGTQPNRSRSVPRRGDVSLASSTHVELSRLSGTAVPERLWSYRFVAADGENTFWNGLLVLKKETLLPREVWVGGARGKGFGRAGLSVTPMEDLAFPSVEERLLAFDEAYRRFARPCGEPPERTFPLPEEDELLWSFVLASPLLLDPAAAEVEALCKSSRSGAAAPGSVHVLFQNTRRGHVGGFWEKAGLPVHRSACLLEGGLVAGTVRRDDLKAFVLWAETVERDGLGLCTEEGWGWVFFAHPWHGEEGVPLA